MSKPRRRRKRRALEKRYPPAAPPRRRDMHRTMKDAQDRRPQCGDEKDMLGARRGMTCPAIPLGLRSRPTSTGCQSTLIRENFRRPCDHRSS